jgi:hypothetical protein
VTLSRTFQRAPYYGVFRFIDIHRPQLGAGIPLQRIQSRDHRLKTFAARTDEPSMSIILLPKATWPYDYAVVVTQKLIRNGKYVLKE